MARRDIKELVDGDREVDIDSAEVIDISSIRSGVTRYGDDYRVADFTITDGTGEINLVLWNNQIDRASKASLVKVFDGDVTSFNGKLHLNLKYNKEIIVIPFAFGLSRSTDETVDELNARIKLQKEKVEESNKARMASISAQSRQMATRARKEHDEARFQKLKEEEKKWIDEVRKRRGEYGKCGQCNWDYYLLAENKCEMCGYKKKNEE